MSAAASLLVGLYLGVTSAYSTAVSLNLSTAELSDLSILLPAAMRVAGAFITSSIDLVAVSALVVVLSSMIYYYIIKYYGFWRTIHAGVLAIWLWALIKRAGIILQQPHAIAPTESSTFLFILTAVLGVVTLGITVAMTRILRSIYGKQFKRSAVKKQ
jgi:hypothetical protein